MIHPTSQPLATRRAQHAATAVVATAVVALSAAPAARAAAETIAIRPIDEKEAQAVSYATQIHPLLAEKCSDCHSGASAKGGLNVATLKAILKGGKHGPAIVPGKPDDSLLVQYIRGHKKPQMPIGDDPLTVDELHLIRQWIAAGARDDSAEHSAKAAVAPAEPASISNLPVEDESGLSLEQIRAKHLARLPAPPAVPVVKVPFHNEIDRFIAARWLAQKLPVPPVCDDATFMRRVYLDVIGVIPTPTEAQTFIADQSPDKRTKLIDTLLARNDEYAAHWMPWWEEALMSMGKHQGGAGSRPNLRGWLSTNLKNNRPYDEMVVELIDPTYPGATVKQAVNWIRNGDHTETIQTAANVAQVFEGTALKCASCHNHFLNKEWPQKKFLAFASYFAPKDLEVIRCEVREGEFVKPAFIFDQPAARQAVPADLKGRLKLVSRLIVDPENPRFARNLVNRLWKRYLGLGLVEPADDFRADRGASHPELLAWLADDFMRHGYDLKHTIRLILTSRTYQLKYDPKLADTFDIGKPDLARFYRSPSLRRLTAEQLLDSINMAIGGNAPRLYLDENSTPLYRALGKPPTRNEVTTARPDDVAVVQALELLNGEEFNSRMAAGKLSAELSREKDLAQAVTRAYWSVYSRPPTAAEIEAGRRFLADDFKSAPPDGAAPEETIWIEDEPPAGSKLTGDWEWVTNGVHSGQKAHGAPVKEGAHQHFFIGATDRLKVRSGDTLFCYVYIDPAQKPREIMLQWNDGTWDHRAYWGENLINFGADGTPTRFRMGDLPEAGKWVRLEIAADQVGLAGREINGISFDQFGGRVLFDRAGIVHNGAPIRQSVIDMLWALMASPEFGYIK